jgi:gas vesicle protein
MRTFWKFLLGAVIGGLLGSALALLFAPVAGNDLRERIRDYCTNIRNEVKTAATNKSLELQSHLATLQRR